MQQILRILPLRMNNLYLWLNTGTLLFPLLLSFDRRVAFYRKWYALFPAIFITAAFFLIWDAWFTEMGIWDFNARYLTGYYLGSLPVEEVMFFFTVPYACVFIYECLIAYVNRNEIFEELHRWFTLLFFGIACTMLYWYHDRLYTAITSLLLSLMLGTHLTVIRRRYMSWFYFAYLTSLIPMLLVNGILTSRPVVWYNPEEISGIRLTSIPAEDFLYNMTMLLMCTGLYEWFKRMRHRHLLRRRTQSS